MYDESVFDDYTLLAVMTPSYPAGSPPKVGDLFVYNLEVYITVENSRPAAVSETTPCYLLITAVSKADLESVNLKLFNISFN